MRRFSPAVAVLAALMLSAAPRAGAAVRRAKAGQKSAGPAAAQRKEQVQPGSAAWLLDKARALLASKDYAGAAEAARSAGARAPGRTEPHLITAEALYALKDYPGAYSEASAVLSQDPTNAQARRIAAVAKGHIPGLATAVIEPVGLGTPKPRALPLGLHERRWILPLGAAALLLGVGLAVLIRRWLTGRSAARRGEDEVPSAPPLRTESYRIVREIGLGGMGRVFEAVDVHLDRRVAIKKLRDEIRSNPRERERFLQEARLVAALRHPNIVLIHSVSSDEEEAYLVFEYIDGHTVAQYISHWGRLQFGQTVWVAQGAAAALDYAHSRGVVHRDLKPSNIMITTDGLLKVMDFGVARQAKDSVHSLASLTVAGTPPYMAPEQEEGGATPQCDVFALGVCVYEMLTGTMPFRGSGAGMVLQKQRKDYIPASQLAEGLPLGVDDTLAWALEPAPSARCARAGAFVANLEALLRGERPKPGKVRW